MFIFNKINLAIGLVKTTAKTVRCITQIRKLPFIISIGAILICSFLLFIFIQAFTVGSINTIKASSNKIFKKYYLLIRFYSLNL